MLFVDLDGFKQVNDQLGDDAGDLMLKEAARRLSACVREADTVSRFSGDEFVLLLRNITDPVHSTRVAKKVVASIDRPFDLGTQLRHIGASIGIAHYPDDGDDYQAVVKAADAAMYEAKKNETGSRALASGVCIAAPSSTVDGVNPSFLGGIAGTSRRHKADPGILP